MYALTYRILQTQAPFSVMEGFEASQGVIAGGLKVSLTPTLYGLMIYILSVVLRAVRTWRQA